MSGTIYRGDLMAGTGLAPDKKRIKELEDDNRRLSEIEQRRISEAITQADSIAELREQLAALREAAREVVDGKQRHSLKRRTVVNVHLMKLAELLEAAKQIGGEKRMDCKRCRELEGTIGLERIATHRLEAENAKLREENEKYRLGMQENCQLRKELAELRETITPILDRLLEEQSYSDVGSFGPVINKLATLLQEKGE